MVNELLHTAQEVIVDTFKIPLYAVRARADDFAAILANRPGSCGTDWSRSCRGRSNADEDLQDCQPLESHPAH